jgi:hypothetical protein
LLIRCAAKNNLQHTGWSAVELRERKIWISEGSEQRKR